MCVHSLVTFQKQRTKHKSKAQNKNDSCATATTTTTTGLHLGQGASKMLFQLSAGRQREREIMPMATPPLLTADFPIDNQETEPKRAKPIGQKVAIRKAFIAPLYIGHISSGSIHTMIAQLIRCGLQFSWSRFCCAAILDVLIAPITIPFRSCLYWYLAVLFCFLWFCCFCFSLCFFFINYFHFYGSAYRYQRIVHRCANNPHAI